MGLYVPSILTGLCQRANSPTTNSSITMFKPWQAMTEKKMHNNETNITQICQFFRPSELTNATFWMLFFTMCIWLMDQRQQDHSELLKMATINNDIPKHLFTLIYCLQVDRIFVLEGLALYIYDLALFHKVIKEWPSFWLIRWMYWIISSFLKFKKTTMETSVFWCLTISGKLYSTHSL